MLLSTRLWFTISFTPTAATVSFCKSTRNEVAAAGDLGCCYWCHCECFWALSLPGRNKFDKLSICFQCVDNNFDDQKFRRKVVWECIRESQLPWQAVLKFKNGDFDGHDVNSKVWMCWHRFHSLVSVQLKFDIYFRISSNAWRCEREWSMSRPTRLLKKWYFTT